MDQFSEGTCLGSVNNVLMYDSYGGTTLDWHKADNAEHLGPYVALSSVGALIPTLENRNALHTMLFLLCVCKGPTVFLSMTPSCLLQTRPPACTLAGKSQAIFFSWLTCKILAAVISVMQRERQDCQHALRISSFWHVSLFGDIIDLIHKPEPM